MALKKQPRRKKPKLVKVVPSGVPTVYPDVQVHDTTLGHIRQKHPEEFTRLQDVYQTIQSPSRVHQSKTRPGAVTLLNDNITNRGGDPLRVAVHILGPGQARMATAHFSSSKDQGKLLWTAVDEDDTSN